MVEIQVPIRSSNEGVRAARRELKGWLTYLNDKLTGERYDRHDTATGAYVFARTLLALLEKEVARQDAAVARAAQPAPTKEPTIRERRGR